MAKINPFIFRQYDIRGIADKDLTDEVIDLIARAFSTYLKERNYKDIIIGHDNRSSSGRIHQTLISSLLEEGLNVIDIGLTLTPILYFAREFLKVNPAIMITGSHTPPHYNGLKLCLGPGSIYGEEIQKIREIVEKQKFSKKEEKKGKLFPTLVNEDYIKAIVTKIKLQRPLKVVVDTGNGTSSLIAPRLIRELGCQVIALYDKPDPNFPNHFPDPVKMENLQDLIKKVQEEKADVGLAFDDDADRLGAINEKGEVVWGDYLLILFSRELLKKNPHAKIIVEVKCSQALIEDIKAHGGNPILWKTGHSLIKAKMREEGALLAGEMSGHMFFKDEYYGFDDALYAAGRLLRILSQTDKTFSQLLEDAPRYFSTHESRVECPDEEKFKVIFKLTQEFKKEYKVIDIDGARVLFEDGWGLVRASNTEPKLILRAEAKTKEKLEEIKKIFEEKLRKFPSVGEIRW